MQDTVDLNEALATVEGVAAWLSRAKEGVSLMWQTPDGQQTVYVEDAKRAGFILRCLMQTAGQA